MCDRRAIFPGAVLLLKAHKGQWFTPRKRVQVVEIIVPPETGMIKCVEIDKDGERLPNQFSECSFRDLEVSPKK